MLVYLNADTGTNQHQLPSMPTKSSLRTFVDIISDAVSQIDEIYISAGLSFPTLNETFDLKQPVDALLLSSDVVKNVSLVVSASEQLCLSLRHPGATILELASAVSKGLLIVRSLYSPLHE